MKMLYVKERDSSRGSQIPTNNSTLHTDPCGNANCWKAPNRLVVPGNGQSD